VLLPVYLHFLGLPGPGFAVPLTVAYTLAIAFLMVSRLPVLSGKKVGKRVPPDLLLPVFVGVVLFVALLIAYPWPVLAIGTVLYLASLPFGWTSYRDHVRRDAEVKGPLPTEAQNAGPPETRVETAADLPASPNGPGSPSPGNQGAVLPFERGGERPTGR
jgi:CDP-diacylglycerol---serine O-phosphatidyltransferase